LLKEVTGNEPPVPHLKMDNMSANHTQQEPCAA